MVSTMVYIYYTSIKLLNDHDKLDFWMHELHYCNEAG